MTGDITPDQVPDDADPVCGRCKRLAAWVGDHWEHAHAADAVFCGILFPPGQPAPDDPAEADEAGYHARRAAEADL